jgi:hypothetical protein
MIAPVPIDPQRLVVRGYREGDEEPILDLFERAFHHRRSLARWRWEYRENPYGNGRISLAVLDDEAAAGGEGRREVLAHYAGYPVRFRMGGGGEETVLAHHVGDTMTAPEARGVGRGDSSLLARTLRHFYATFCTGRIGFNFGTNTGKIQRFSRRTAGALRLEAVPFRVRTLDRPFPSPGRLALRWGGWSVERIERWDERWDDLWRRARSAYGTLVERDARYLAWRHGACPDALPAFAVFRRRRLVGWSVFRRLDDDRLVWGDALFDPRHPQAVGLLLARAVAAPELAGARTLEGWLTPRPAWWSDLVAGLGFAPRPEPEDLGLVYVPFDVDPGERFAQDLYYTKADSDLL